MGKNVCRRLKLRTIILDNLNFNKSIHNKIKKWLRPSTEEMIFMQENSDGQVRDIYDELFFIKLKVNPPEIKINTELCMDKTELITLLEKFIRGKKSVFSQYIVSPIYRSAVVSFFTYLALTVTT